MLFPLLDVLALRDAFDDVMGARCVRVWAVVRPA